MMKKLNNKGFTLIELLAVIVILAVVMAIAARSVLGVMNDSRKSALLDSASSAASSFSNAYAESIISNKTTVFGISFAGTTISPLTSDTITAFSELGITEKDYTSDSFVYFDGDKFLVCLVANPSGSYNVANAVGGTKTVGSEGNTKSLTATQMWACSDGTHSWTD